MKDCNCIRNKMSARSNKAIRFILLLLTVPVLHFLLFWLWPNSKSILMAFQVPGKPGFTLVNFQRFWDELTIKGSTLLPSIKNTLLLFFFGNFINLPIVIFLSYTLHKKIAGYKVFRVIFYLPSILGSSVMGALYRYCVSTGGPLDAILQNIGVEYNRQLGLLGNPDTVFMMIIIYTLWCGVGVNMIMLNGAMSRIPTEVLESARIDGVGFWREFFQIVCPLIWPTITTLLIFGMAGIFVNYGATMLLAPDVPEASTVGWYIVRFTMSAGASANEIYNYPAAVGIVFTVIGLPLVLMTKWLWEKISSQVEY